ncbi:MAG: hypothetical protein HY974_01240 [Candidatus Kerfeldbacteria bacterium]|nr:hypothetical protein [Candidatus Kerfeldbacteria bacterium]
MNDKVPVVEHDQHDLSPQEVRKRHEFIDQALQLAKSDHWSEFIDYLLEAVGHHGYSTMVMFDCLADGMNLWGQENTWRALQGSLRDRFIDRQDIDCEMIGPVIEALRESPGSFKQERFSRAFLQAVVDHIHCCRNGCGKYNDGDGYSLVA